MLRDLDTNWKVRKIIIQQFYRSKSICQVANDLVIRKSTIEDIVK